MSRPATGLATRALTSRWTPLVLALLALALAANSSLRNRPFEAPDELEHYQFVRFLLDRRALPALDASGPLSQYHQPPLYYLGGALLVAGIEDDGQLPERNPQWLSYKPGEVHRDNKAQFLPLPSFRFPYSGAARVLHLLRLWSLLLLVITLFLMWRLVSDVWPARPARRLLAFILFSFNPMLLYIAGSANNDNLVMLLGALMLWLSLRALQRGFPWHITLAIGLVWAAALLTKLNGLLLAIPWMVALLVTLCQKRDWRQALSRLLAIVAIAAILAGWWFARNQSLYGEPFALETMLDIWGERQGLAPRALAEAAMYAWQSLWGRFGYGQIVLPAPFYWAFTFLALCALAGGLWRVRRVPGRSLLAARWLVLALTVSAYAAALAYFIVRNPSGANGRYLFPALPALAILVSAGLSALPSARLFQAAAAAVLLVSAFYALLWLVPWTYSAPSLVSLQEARARLANPMDITWQEALHFLGTTVQTQGDEVVVDGCWEAGQKVARDYIVYVHLMGHDLRALGQRDTYPGLGNYPTSLWQAGDIFCERYRVPWRSPGLDMPEVARIAVGVYDPETGEQLPARAASGDPVALVVAGEVRVSPAAPAVLPTPAQQTEATFEQGVTLAGYDWSTATAAAGETVVLQVWWHARGALDDNYTVFAHLLDEDGGLLAQADQQPQQGRYPTAFWQPGETIVDTHTFVLPREAAPGPTQVALGLYRLADDQRLQREPGAAVADAVILPGPTVIEP